MNVDFTFGTLYVDGILKFEEGITPSEINLIANNICINIIKYYILDVRYGNIEAGNVN